MQEMSKKDKSRNVAKDTKSANQVRLGGGGGSDGGSVASDEILSANRPLCNRTARASLLGERRLAVRPGRYR